MESFINSVRNKRSVSPVVRRLLELSIHYQQQEQNNQNHPTSSNVNPAELNKQTEKKIRALVKQINKSKRNGSIEELEKAILHKDSRTRCVTIPR
jgi:negative regulator of replication initiation